MRKKDTQVKTKDKRRTLTTACTYTTVSKYNIHVLTKLIIIIIIIIITRTMFMVLLLTY